MKKVIRSCFSFFLQQFNHITISMALSKASKTKQLANLKTTLKNAKSVVVADYTGLSVNLTNDLRKKLAESNADLTVAKNSLIELALREEKIDGETPFVGQTAIITASGDALAPIKGLFEFIKEFNLPKVKLGFMDGKTLTGNDVEMLSKIPSREVLIGRMLGSLMSPISGTVNVLSGLEKKLVYALNAIVSSRA